MEQFVFTIDMVPEPIREYISKATDKNGKLSSIKLRYMPQDFKDWFESNKNVMSPRTLFNLMKNGLNSIPFCEYCHKVQLTPQQYEKGHYYCCNQHAQLDSKTQEKISKAFEGKYANGHPLKDPKIRNKIKKTNLERYGNEVACNTEEWKQKIKERNIEQYGVEHTLQRPDVITKRCFSYIQTCMERYGVTNTSKIPELREKAETNRKITLWSKMQETAKERNLELVSTLNDYLNHKQFKYKCIGCGNEFESQFAPFRIICETCHPKKEFVSNKEISVAEWIRSIYPGIVETSNRSLINPYELDILIPEKKVAIEFDGIYWHSERFKEKDYHQRKTILCREQGIRLIHIPELVWDYQNAMIKEIIKNALGLTENKIYARNTKVVELDASTYRNFLFDNHIQGPIDSKYRYGLMYGDTLVSVLGYGMSRFKKGEQELHRFCSLMGYNVIGGFQKLLKHSGFEGVSYIDLNYFDGSGYKEAGFKEIGITEPSYEWYNSTIGKVYSRYQAQKSKLEKILDAFDPLLSETQNMELNGYVKIYDSGTLKVEYHKQQSIYRLHYGTWWAHYGPSVSLMINHT